MPYVKRMPPKPKAGTVPTWHRTVNLDSPRTSCMIKIREYWVRQEEPPPTGERGCYNCFPSGKT